MNADVMGNWFANQMLAYLFVNGCWISLHTDDPTPVGVTSTELAGGGYDRQFATWSAPSGKATATTNGQQFDGLVPAQVNFIGAWDSEVGGDFMMAWGLNPAEDVSVTASFLVAPASLALSLP